MKFLLIVWACCLSALSLSLSLESEQIIQECNESYTSCNVIITTNNNEKIRIFDDYPFYSSIIMHGKNIIQVIANCGSPCQTFIFVNLKTAKVEHVENPVRFSYKHLLSASLKDGSLVIKELFSDKVLSTTRINFSPVANASSAIKDFSFINERSIKITYLSTTEYVRKTQVITF
jgi:hypothetical protein